jgi:hypothetical protein
LTRDIRVKKGEGSKYGRMGRVEKILTVTDNLIR